MTRNLTDQLNKMYHMASGLSAQLFKTSERTELSEKQREKLQAMGETLGGYLVVITHMRWMAKAEKNKSDDQSYPELVRRVRELEAEVKDLRKNTT